MKIENHIYADAGLEDLNNSNSLNIASLQKLKELKLIGIEEFFSTSLKHISNLASLRELKIVTRRNQGLNVSIKHIKNSQ